ncbi:beta-eliminating lyase-related protein [Actinomadura sp. WMMA1423]|uniref:beta-eliminating lyase-related protein n=1 Tax=Actinomadura sp. WMMA1423 TaxID=2591108 RepID=UPI001146B1D2|nr:beta-eliminating lyase-related protein [Actinomadura sp. WMMA1423]
MPLARTALRSATCSRPTAAMRRAIATAVAGNDVYNDDPTVRELEAQTTGPADAEDIVIEPAGVQTEIVRFRLDGAPSNSAGVRAVFHLDLTQQDINDAPKGVRDGVANLGHSTTATNVAGY